MASQDVIGSQEVVSDHHTGLLVPPAHPAALAEALGALLADPRLRERYGRAGQRRYSQHFTSVRMAEQTRTVYEQALRTSTAAASAPT